MALEEHSALRRGRSKDHAPPALEDMVRVVSETGDAKALTELAPHGADPSKGLQGAKAVDLV
jgi:hypothetical protein